MRLLLALVVALAVSPALGASLRTATTLHGQNVYLRDLFDDAGRYADRLLGPGPGPGDRIVVEAPQLNAIARQYDVAWRSISSGDRAILEWPGRPLSRDAASEAIRSAVAATGDTADYDIDMPDFPAPMVPAEGTPGLMVSQFEQDGNAGRFSAVLTVTADGMAPRALRVAGRMEPVIEAPVSVTRLYQDMVIRAGDVKLARVIKTASESEFARSADQVVGMQLRRPVAAGQPLRLADLTRPPLVRKGELVQAELNADGLSVAGQVMSLDTGGDGEVVRVQNTTSHLFLFARVVGPGQVSVTPDSAGAFTTIPPRSDPRISLR
jgi:flagella basal body P-ring formation protein FlgA